MSVVNRVTAGWTMAVVIINVRMMTLNNTGLTISLASHLTTTSHPARYIKVKVKGSTSVTNDKDALG